VPLVDWDGPDRAGAEPGVEVADQVRHACLDATRAERLVLMLYYGLAMTSAEIGRVIGVSESSVSLMRTDVMLRLTGSRPPTRQHYHGPSSRRRSSSAA
jgi:RNA polymerase sigma factor for flagellar operon FliA